MTIRPKRKSVLSFLEHDFKTIEVERQEPFDDWVKPLLDETLEKPNRVFWYPFRKNFRGSMVGDECVRSLTLTLFGHNVPLKAHTLRIFRVGKKVEDGIVEDLASSGTIINTQEVLTYENPPILGKSDIVIKDPNSETILLGEIKSINSRGFSYLPKEHGFTLASESPLFKTKQSYIRQWNIYANAPGKEHEEGFLLFEEKDLHKQKIFYLRRDKELFNEDIERMRTAWNYFTSEMVAPIPFDRNPSSASDKTCKWCDKKYLCLAIGEENMSIKAVKKIDKGLR